MNNRAILITLLLLACAFANAREADYFTKRKGFPDTTTILNGKMNAVLQHIGQTSESCSEADLQGAIMGALGGFITPTIETWSDELPGNYGVPFDQSVFAGLQSEAKYLDWGCCSPVFRVGESLVSGDKLGHFLHSGFEMYYIVKSISTHPIPDARDKITKVFDWWESAVDSPKIDALKEKLGAKNRALGDSELAKVANTLAIEASHVQEEGSWGLGGTGVKSYADIASNYEGFKFWSDLTRGARPYFTCSKNKWVLSRRFKWETYVSDAWDEGINCNTYVTKKFAAVVAERTKRLAEKHKYFAGNCPVEPQKCKALVQRYDDKLARVIAPECRAAGGLALLDSEKPATPIEVTSERLPTAASAATTAAVSTPPLSALKIRDDKQISHPAFRSVIECFNTSLSAKSPAQSFEICAKPHFAVSHNSKTLRHNTLFLSFTDEVSELRPCESNEQKLAKAVSGRSTVTQCFDLVDKEGRKRKGFAAFNGSNKIASLRAF